MRFTTSSGTFRDLIDMNGDGLSDIVDAGVWTSGNQVFQVVLNRGNDFAPSVTEWDAPWSSVAGPPVRGNGFETMDVNGDGLPERIHNSPLTAGQILVYHNAGGAWCPSVDQQNCASGGSVTNVAADPTGSKPDLLVETENGLGGTSSLRYRPSTQWVGTTLPFVFWNVTQIRRDDGLCNDQGTSCVGAEMAGNHTLVSNIRYESGFYDPVDRQFRGFGKVWQDDGDPEPSTPHLATVTTFMQDFLRAGKLQLQERFEVVPGVNPSSRPLSLLINIWQCADPSTGIARLCSIDGDWVRLSATTDRVYSNYSSGTYRSKSTSNVEWASCEGKFYGNVAHQSVTDLTAGGTTVNTHTIYACRDDDDGYIVDKPSHVKVTNGSETVTLAEKWFFYDFGPPTFVEKGNLTFVDSWLDDPNQQADICSADGQRKCVGTAQFYDNVGNLDYVVDALGRTTQTTYDETRIHAYQTINQALAQETATRYDPACGKVLWQTVTYPAGQVPSSQPRSQLNYDTFCRLQNRTAPDGEVTTAHTYVLGGPQVPTRVDTLAREPNGLFGFRYSFLFTDALGRPLQQQDLTVIEGQSAMRASATIAYDSRGKQIKRYIPFTFPGPANQYAAVPGGTGVTETRYDALGRATRVEHPDEKYREIDHAVAWETTSRDECFTASGCSGSKVIEKRDAFRNVVERQIFDEAGALQTKTRSTYDALGRLRVTEQGDATGWIGATQITITYDSLGRQIQKTDPDTGTPSAAGDWKYSYDPLGNLVYQDDPETNQHLEFCYDGGNRLRRKYYLAGDSYVGGHGNCADAAPQSLTFIYDQTPNGLGLLHRVDDLAGSTAYAEYDVRRRLKRIDRTTTINSSSIVMTTRYGHDAADHLTSVIYPGGEVVNYGYDLGGQLVSVDGDDEYVTDITYDVFGRQRTLYHGNGTTDDRTYSLSATEGFRLTEIATRDVDQDLIQRYTYHDYTPTGLLGRLDDHKVQGSTDNSATYTYDPLGRLRQASGGGIGTRTYDYDSLGNIKLKDGAPLVYSATKPHQLTRVNSASVNVTHDLNGNRITKPGQSYTYDMDDRIVHVVAGGVPVDFSYDHEGERVATETPGEVTYYGGKLFETMDDGWIVKNYFAGDLVVAQRREWRPDLFASLSGAPATHVAAMSDGWPIFLKFRSDVEMWLVGGLVVSTVALLAAPWRRRRVVGIRVRHGHAVLAALALGHGTIPWPILAPPAEAQCQGCECPTPTPAPGGVLKHYHVDQLGSVQMVTDASGQSVIEHIRYYPYGEVRSFYNSLGGTIAEDASLRYGFTQYEREPVSDLQYAGARFYDPALGMFLTHDPARQFASPYTYGAWNPTNLTDPGGECIFDLGISCGTLAVILVAATAVATAIDTGVRTGDAKAAFTAGAIAGAIGIATLGVGAGVVAPAVGAIQNAAVQQAVGQALATVAIGGGVYGTAQSFANGYYASGVVGAVLTAFSMYQLLQGGGSFSDVGDPKGIDWNNEAEVGKLQRNFDYASISPTSEGEFIGELAANGVGQVQMDIARYGSSSLQEALASFNSQGGHFDLRPDKTFIHPDTGEPASGQWYPYSEAPGYSRPRIEFYSKALRNFDHFERVFVHELGHNHPFPHLPDRGLGTLTAYDWERRQYGILQRNRGS